MTREEGMIIELSDRVAILEKIVKVLTEKLKENVVSERKDKRVQGKFEK